MVNKNTKNKIIKNNRKGKCKLNLYFCHTTFLQFEMKLVRCVWLKYQATHKHKATRKTY